MFKPGEAAIGEPVEKERIVKSLDLLRIIVSERVNLDKNDMGLCPFHDEKTGSFHVFKAKSGRARFHCFGCGAQGDVFTYMRLTDDLGFSAAIAKLSEMLNREIKTEVISSRAPEYSVINTEFCEQSCEKYARFREDYNLLLEENEALRAKIGLEDFQPINELSGDKKIAEWVVKTCETFNASTATAYRVAGLFIQGFNK